MKHLIRGICNKAGISTGRPSDITLMKRFYRAKDVWLERKKEYARNEYSKTWFAGSEGFIDVYDVAIEHLRIIEEVEHILFETEFLDG